MRARFAAASPSSSRRLGAALAISALAHALLSGLVKPGAAGHNAPEVSPGLSATISVRIAPSEPQLPTLAPDAGLEIATAAPLSDRKKMERPAPSTRAGTPSSAGPAEIPDPTYYSARELDVYPALAAALDLSRAPSNGSGDTRGRVVLRVLIDAGGRVDEVSVVEAEPPGLLGDDAVRSMRAARFKPALRNGRAVRSRIVVHVSYGAESSSQ